MDEKSVATPPPSKGDIIEFVVSTGRFWGICIGLNWVVYVSTKGNGSGQRKARFLVDYIWRPESTVHINKIENLVESPIFYRINNSVNSHWNLLSKPDSPDKIVERALEEIGRKTPLTSEEFVMYCRYGSNTKLVSIVIAISVASIILSLARVQESVKSVLTEHHFELVMFMYVLFSTCFVISILTYIPKKPKSEQKT